jgi:thymidylate kinase
MRLEDDTPERGETPKIFPRESPRNLLPPGLLVPANFYAMEGLDASGKSTVLDRVAKLLGDRGLPVQCLKLAGSELIHHAMERAKWTNADPVTLNLLNWVSLYDQTIALREHYNTNSILFADRYVLSVRIRGQMEGLAPDFMDILERGVPRPRIFFILDCPTDICIERIRASRRRISYFEAGFRDVEATGHPMQERNEQERHINTDRELLFRRHLDRMRAAYYGFADRYENVQMIDSSGAVDAVASQIIEHIDQ